ncbi:MAG TPA: S8/S53 family peptidase [Chitinophagaceae bacterium]|nr:S8/S53 family peptidase [Chitinophagaceae bacterium]
MECFNPGEVIVQPVEGGKLFFENQEYDVIYSVEDVIDYYIKERKELKSKFYSFPAVVRVPEGEELEFSKRYRSNKNIRAAIPNFHLSPLQDEPHINHKVIEDLMELLHCRAQSSICGQDVKIAVLDTGINPSLLPFPHKVFGNQYATDIPTSTLTPIDNNGHGSLVAYIINSIAPGAEIISFKVMDTQGNVGSLLSGLYLAETEFKPDIYNLSLAVSCDLGACAYCGNDVMINTQQLELLFEMIDRQRATNPLPLIVAAAGNNSSTIKMPASFNNVLSVGSYTPGTPYKGYSKIDSSKYILAPGGLRTRNESIAFRPYFSSEILYEGTSFATAFVSGISARFFCSKNGFSPCNNMHPSPLEGREFVMECLNTYADKSFAGYALDKHGFGLVRYH